MSKVKLKEMPAIKVGSRAKLRNFKYGQDVEGMVTKDLNGFYLVFERLVFNENEDNVNHELNKEIVEIYLTAENKTDSEDLYNINDILRQEQLSFVSWVK